MIDNREVERIYSLANLELKEKDLEMLKNKYNKVLEFTEMVFQVDTADTEMMEMSTDHLGILREDIPKQSLTREEALFNAKNTEYGYFRLKKVVE